MVLEKSTEDDWWKAKKKGGDEEDEEPEGLIPNNYVEEAQPVAKARTLYDYTRQTDEELSFNEDATVDVYDLSDPDWTLVGADGEYGFAPANYLDVKEGAPSPATVASPSLPTRSSAVPAARAAPPAPDSDDDQQPPTPDSPVHQSPAAALAGIIQKKSEQTGAPRSSTISPPPKVNAAPKRVQFTPEESDEEAPPPRLPQRPPSEQFSPPPTRTQFASPRSPESPPPRASRSVTFDPYDAPEPREQPHTPLSASGYHLYNIYEYLTQPGKNKKMPITLGINVPKGTIMLAPEKARDGHQQEWTAEKLEYYSQEGKHVFMELKQPSKSVDLHCGAKDTASEIIAALGELSGAAKASGLREVLAAGSGRSNVQKKGVMLFDFMAQGEDEVNVAMGDEVLVIDDSASDEWWKVRRLRNGKEGVVPSNYVDITESAPASTSARSGLNGGRSTVDQNRREEEEVTRQASKSKRRNESDSRADQRSKRDSSTKDTKTSAKPNTSKIRTWTDRSGSFKVEAEFLTIKDNKIHLHKVNGVKIAVPVAKMAIEDLEYVERATGISLDDDKPLSDIKRRSTQRLKEKEQEQKRSSSGISIEQKPGYDWFDFFLACGVNPQICERYAQAFNRDQMTEENIPDITEKLLRTLGLKEGDILRVTKHLDNKFGRSAEREKRSVSFAEGGEDGSGGGLFSGPGGVLRNNTRKGRPAPPVQTSDVVDAKAFEQKTDDAPKKPVDATPTPIASAPVPEKKAESSGFEDNAWDVKPSRQASGSSPAQATPIPTPAAAPAPTPAAAAPAAASIPPPPAPAPVLTGGARELSILMPAITPDVPPQAAPAQPLVAQSTQPAQLAPLQGATTGLFDSVAAIRAAPPEPLAPPRVRPQAPTQQGTNGLIAPPPQRAISAPQNLSPAPFGPPPPLQQQLTGVNPNLHVPIAPPGQSLSDLQRLQQQQQMYAQQNNGFSGYQNGLPPQPTGQFGGMQQPLQPYQTGIAPFQQSMPTGFQQSMPTGFQQPMPTGFQQPMPTGFPSYAQQGYSNGSPFADPPRAPFQPMSSIAQQPTGYGNSFSSPPIMPQGTGMNRFSPAIQPSPIPPMPPMPPMPSNQIQPLVPQRTGPAPSIKFGVQPAKKLTPQPTGRANLAKATPDNPFGF